MQDAIARAQAWIGDRAPDEFRRNLQFVSLLAIQAGTIYRACVPNVDGTQSYCVIVNRSMPFEHSVRFSGYEPNSVAGRRRGVAVRERIKRTVLIASILGSGIVFLDQTIVNVALPAIRVEPARQPGRPAVGRRGLPADAVLAAAARGLARRRARAQARVHGGPGRLRGVLAGCARRAEQRGADRGARRSGSRGRAARAEHAGADRRHFEPRASARRRSGHGRRGPGWPP